MPGLDCSKITLPVCLQSSEVVSSINPVEFVSITLCVHAHVGVSWDHKCEQRGSLGFAGSSDQRAHRVTWVTVLSLFSHSSFFSWQCRKTEEEEWKVWKFLDLDDTECCCSAHWREEGNSRYSGFPHSHPTKSNNHNVENSCNLRKKTQWVLGV